MTQPKRPGNWCDGHREHVHEETRAFTFPHLPLGVRMLCPICFWNPVWQAEMAKVTDKLARRMIDWATEAWASAQPTLADRREQIERDLARLYDQRSRTQKCIDALLAEQASIALEENPLI